MPRLIAIAGSLRPSSATRMALEIAVQGALARGGAGWTVETASLQLPLFGEEEANDPRLAGFRAQMKGASAMLISTPVYHDSLSGVLKNALDFLQDELEGTPVGLISVGGGRSGHGQALEHLRASLREMNADVLNRQVIVAKSSDAFDSAGKAKDTELHERLAALGDELVLRLKS